MKRLYLTSNTGFPSPNCGGSNKIIYEINRYLHHSAYDVHYLSYDLHSSMNNNADGNNYGAKRGVKKKAGSMLYRVNPLYRWIVTSAFYYGIYARKRQKYFHSICSRVVPDLVHAHHPLGFFEWINNSKVKKILTLHNKGSYVHEMRSKLGNNFIPETEFDVWDEIETKAFNTADVVTFPSKAAYEMFVDTKLPGVLKNERIEIVYNGVDIERIRDIDVPPGFCASYRVPDGRQIVLNVANHVKFKNVDLLIEAIHRYNVRHNNKLFFINISTGPTSETTRLRNLVSKFGMENDVLFLFELQNEDVIRFMKQCLCLVMPGEFVVFDMVILEALAAGCRVIASKSGGNREIIIDNLNGTFLPTISIEAIEFCLNHVAQGSIIHNEQKTAVLLSTGEMTERYEKLYSQCLQY